jgi:hypothetical protein
MEKHRNTAKKIKVFMSIVLRTRSEMLAVGSLSIQ